MKTHLFIINLMFIIIKIDQFIIIKIQFIIDNLFIVDFNL